MQAQYLFRHMQMTFREHIYNHVPVFSLQFLSILQQIAVKQLVKYLFQAWRLGLTRNGVRQIGQVSLLDSQGSIHTA